MSDQTHEPGSRPQVIDLEAEMRSAGLPLFSVDSHRPASEFDLLAFNLSAELTYTNLLNCVDLAGVGGLIL